MSDAVRHGLSGRVSLHREGTLAKLRARPFRSAVEEPLVVRIGYCASLAGQRIMQTDKLGRLDSASG